MLHALSLPSVCQYAFVLHHTYRSYYISMQALLAAISFDGLDWDVSPAKQELVVFNKDQTVYISISSKKVTPLSLFLSGTY